MRSPQQRRRVVIVGASVAGLTAAESLRAEGFSGEVVLVGAEEELPYARPPLSKQLLLGSWVDAQATIRSASEIAELGVELRLGSAAEGLDIRKRQLHLEGETLSYDELIIATGAAAHMPGPFTAQSEVHVLRTLADVQVLRQKLQSASNVLILGGGVLGSEIASAVRSRGCEAVLVGRSEVLSFGSAGPLLSSRLAALHRSHGVALRLGSSVRDVLREGEEIRVVLSDGALLRGDLIVAATGSVPVTAWLRGSGLDISDGVLCDAHGVAAPGVHAIGDVARWADPLKPEKARRVEHQTNAIEQAIAVARSIVHHSSSGPPTPFFWSEVHGVRIQAYGTFDPEDGLRPVDVSEDGARLVLVNGEEGAVSGVIGWNAARAFRRARALVDGPSRTQHHDPQPSIEA